MRTGTIGAWRSGSIGMALTRGLAHARRGALVLGMCGAALCASLARAQESIAGEVWLGSKLFTIEDVENLNDAAKLSPEQQEAATELMRGAMSRSRTMSLKFYRGWEDVEWGDNQEENEKKMKEVREQTQKQLEELARVEKDVMTDLKALLDEKQADAGWAKFERSRRRLLLRSSGNSYGGMYGQQPVVDVVAMVRACKLSDAEKAELATPLDQYEGALDALIIERRPLEKQNNSNSPWGWYGGEQKEMSEGDQAKLADISKRLRELTIRTSHKVEDTLTGASKEKYQRQRLRQEDRWSWMPAKRSPRVDAMLRLKSITPEQKSTFDGLIKQADSELLKLAMSEKRKRDEETLLGKKEEQENYGGWGGGGNQESQKAQNKIRKKLGDEMLALLTPAQRTAYDTGVENDADLTKAFEGRRHGSDQWELDRDMMPSWDERFAQEEE